MRTPAKKLPLLSANSAPQSEGDEVSRTVQKAESHELVFAIAGHAGAGATQIAKKLGAELKLKKFEPQPIRMSDLIASATGLPAGLAAHERTATLQASGTALRKKHGPSIVAGLAIKAISEARQSIKGTPAFIIDSLKHPEELELLRSVYKSSFYLIGVTCHEATRQPRLELKYKAASDEQLAKIRALDEDDHEAEGQQVRSLLHLADFFISTDLDSANIKKKVDPVANALSRFVRLVTATGIERPTRDEVGMSAAWGASLRSACLSRQVGAAILDPAGNIVSTGTNEVPKKGGGAYDDNSERIEEGEQAKLSVPIGRCFHHKKCFNDEKKAEIYGEVSAVFLELLSQVTEEQIAKLFDGGAATTANVGSKLRSLLATTASVPNISKVLKKTRIGALVEFSRAVHAEMDAIISVARTGGQSILGQRCIAGRTRATTVRGISSGQVWRMWSTSSHIGRAWRWSYMRIPSLMHPAGRHRTHRA
jgi:deoxycytidylate deaminase